MLPSNSSFNGKLPANSSSDPQDSTPVVPEHATAPPAARRTALAEDAEHLASGLLGLASVPPDPPRSLPKEAAAPQPAAQGGRSDQPEEGAQDSGFAEKRLKAQAAAAGVAARESLWHLNQVRCAGCS